jgi:iron complex outermembrane receptor protein
MESILRLDTRRVNGQFSAFYNNIENYITPNIVGDTVVDGESIPLNHTSQATALLRGVEGKLEAEVVPHIVLGTMGDMVRGEFTGSRVPLPFMPAARLGALARYDNGAISGGAEYRHAFAQDRVPAALSTDDPAGLATSSYDLLNLSAGYNLTFHGQVSSITLRIDNAFDERYLDATSRIKTFAFNPGRNFSLVYRVQF